jgi:AcrR family transcriptional regulator
MSSARATKSSKTKADRREALIFATVEEIVCSGLTNMTLSGITERASLSPGAVNFYFDSKESLLFQTLLYAEKELKNSAINAMEMAGPNPTDKILAYFEGSMAPTEHSINTIIAFYAFITHPDRSEEVHELCDAYTQTMFNILHDLVEEIIELGGKTKEVDSYATAYALYALNNFSWGEVFNESNAFDRKKALHLYTAYLGSVFPWCFDLPGKPDHRAGHLNNVESTFAFRRADLSDLKQISKLFRLYREANNQVVDVASSAKFLKSSLEGDLSAIFIVIDNHGEAAGFVQLHQRFSTLEAIQYWSLADLFVASEHRSLGITAALLKFAQEQAQSINPTHIEVDLPFDKGEDRAFFGSQGYRKQINSSKFVLSL